MTDESSTERRGEAEPVPGGADSARGEAASAGGEAEPVPGGAEQAEHASATDRDAQPARGGADSAGGQAEPLRGSAEPVERASSTDRGAEPTRGGAEPTQAESMRSGAAADSERGTQESERLRILELLEQRKITAAEAAELLTAVGNRAGAQDGRRRERSRWLAEELAPPTDRARWIRVRVTDERTGRVRTNVSVPIGMLGFGLGFARRFRGVPGVAMVDEVFEAVRTGRRGTLFDVANEGGERVEILID